CIRTNRPQAVAIILLSELKTMPRWPYVCFSTTATSLQSELARSESWETLRRPMASHFPSGLKAIFNPPPEIVLASWPVFRSQTNTFGSKPPVASHLPHGLNEADSAVSF